MHGAGNDFIIVDDRDLSFPLSDQEWISGIAGRHTGIGCEGVILIQLSDSADFRMRFVNPDGNEVAMCANGARCVSRLAYELGIASAVMLIETGAGLVGAEVVDDAVRLAMPPPADWKLDGSLEVDGLDIPYGFVNTGVEHVVIDMADIDASLNIMKLGASIRYHPGFAPGGTNANFLEITGDRSLRVRTYERGVEAETGACGTGVVASALIAALSGKVDSPVQVTTASGNVLEVHFTLTANSAKNVTLLGPAEHVFRGELDR